MPVAPNSSGGAIDVFLSVQTKRAGKLKGESRAVDHTDEIVVQGWSWGLAASSALGSSQATGRRSYKNLVVTKRIDSSSTSLMSVLATNDEVKEAKLSMRKAGEGQRDYFTIKLSGARLEQVTHEVSATGEARERVDIVFTKVDVEYKQQDTAGRLATNVSFSDEIMPA